jgi:hypothetical protein
MTLFSAIFASPSRVKLAHESGLQCTSAEYQLAAGKYADVATLVAAYEAGIQFTETTIAAAAERNKLAEVQYLHCQGCRWPPRLLEQAAERGRFELLRWCYEHGCPWDAKVVPGCAAASGNVALMAWVLQQPGTELSEPVMVLAAGLGHAPLCQYLHSRHCPWNPYVTHHAALGGRVDVLRWLFDTGCPVDAQ